MEFLLERHGDKQLKYTDMFSVRSLYTFPGNMGTSTSKADLCRHLVMYVLKPVEPHSDTCGPSGMRNDKGGVEQKSQEASQE